MYIYNDRLETERLKTRFLTLDDAEAWTSFYDDPSTAMYVPNPGELAGIERSRFWIEAQLKRYAENRYGMQALIEKGTGTFVGMCGLLLQYMNEEYHLEVGYHLFPRYWGKGFATEAAGMFKNYGFEHELAPSIVSVIHLQNVNSQKVAIRNGMINTKVPVSFFGMDFEIFRISREEWLKQNVG
jgi:RimJ/RimL family protein N-acetyltransferase